MPHPAVQTQAAETPTKRQLQKIATRQKIIAGATALFDAGGYEAATMRSIAKHIDMTTGAVVGHFNGKAELYRAIYGHDPISPEEGRRLRKALSALTYAARTTGGTAGPDAGLMAACASAETVLLAA